MDRGSPTHEAAASTLPEEALHSLARTCWCGAAFFVRVSNQRHCTRACGRLRRKRARAAEKREARPLVKCWREACERRFRQCFPRHVWCSRRCRQLHSLKPRPPPAPACRWTPKVLGCARCGATFTQAVPCQRFCCGRCRDAEKWRRQSPQQRFHRPAFVVESQKDKPEGECLFCDRRAYPKGHKGKRRVICKRRACLRAYNRRWRAEERKREDAKALAEGRAPRKTVGAPVAEVVAELGPGRCAYCRGLARKKDGSVHWLCSSRECHHAHRRAYDEYRRGGRTARPAADDVLERIMAEARADE